MCLGPVFREKGDEYVQRLEAKDNREADAIAYYERARKISPELNDRCSRRLAVLYDKVDNQSQALIEFQDLVRNRR